MSRFLEALWYAPPTLPVMVLRTLLAPLLWPLTVIFDAVTSFRRSTYRSGGFPVYHVDCPVVVVGNLSVGGTGKTPLVIALAQALTAAGCKVGIVTRGYGGRAPGIVAVTAESDPAEVGDEACLLAQETEAMILRGTDRGEAAWQLSQAGVDVILSDDGLQHYGLARDLEIVVVDAARGLGNGWLLPAGPLRESRQRLRSVDWLVLHEATTDSRSLERRAGEAVGLVLEERPQLLSMSLVAGAPRSLKENVQKPLGAWVGQRVHAVAGIGRPERFFGMLRDAGVELVPHAFADHHRFTSTDIPASWAGSVLMTSKDAVKCRAFADERMWEVPVTACLSPAGGEALTAEILALCQRKQPRARGITQGS
jgi:tetraacyldisaccharide 4'-kinase